MYICQPNNVPQLHVRVNVLYPILFLYLLFLFNLVPILFKIKQFCLKLSNFILIKNKIKFNFYIINFNILNKNI